MTTEFNKKRILFFISAFLVVSTLIAYEPIRHNDFVSYDDPRYITENPDIKWGITGQSVVQAFTKPHYYMWHPLTTISHILDWQLFGANPLGHHIVNLLLHIVNALLLFWILTNLTSSIWASGFVAAVFALHPLQVESVAWAAERKTVLSGLFWFVSIAVYIWFTKRPSIRRYVFLFVVYGLCIMTKPIVVTLPFVLLLLDYWPLERVKKISAGRLITEKIPLLALSIILSVITYVSQQQGGAVVTLGKIPLESRIANMFISYMKYIGKLIVPSELAVIYPYSNKHFIDATTAGCALIFILMMVLSIYIGRRRKYAATGWLWFAGTLVPVIGLVQSGSQSIANRYMYISMVGLLIIISWGVKDLIANRLKGKIVAGILAGAVLTSAVILTRMQVRHWENSLALFEHTLKVTENNTIAENSYGCALYDLGQTDEALVHFTRATKINPEYYDARNNLGKIFLKEGKLNEAIACFNEILKQNEKSAEAHYNLAIAMGRQKKYDEAIKQLNLALYINPNYPDAYNKMRQALCDSGRNNEAIAYFNEILQGRKDSADAHYNLAIVLGMEKRYEEAIKHLARVLDIAPHYPDAHNRMGLALQATDRPKEAIEYFKEAIRTGTNKAESYASIGTVYAQLGQYGQAKENWMKAVQTDPNNVKALNNLAWTMATVNKGTIEDANKAIELAKRACELKGNKEAEFLDTLAAAYAAAGRFEEAVKTAGQAVEAAKASGKEDTANEIQDRKKLYQSGERYHQK